MAPARTAVSNCISESSTGQNPFVFIGKLTRSQSMSFDMENVHTHMVNIYSTTLSKFIKQHGQQSSTNMVKHRPQTWSNIVKQHGQQSSTALSNIINKHGQQS
jgi:hypothetical protein